jgi:hypothetical protein
MVGGTMTNDAPSPAQRWTIELDDDNAADVWIPNDPEAERLLANVIERAGLRAWSEGARWGK